MARRTTQAVVLWRGARAGGIAPLIALTGVLACADDLDGGSNGGGNGPADAAADAGPRDGADIGSPEPPAPPVFTPCPEGWEPVVNEDGLEVCDPWPGGGPVNWPCPEGWSEIVPEGEPELTSCSPGEDWDPIQWDCPEGWQRVDLESGGHLCDPYGDDGAAEPDECGPFEAHFPGEDGCTSIGTPCPEGPFAEDLPTDVPIVYVQPGATGDGTTPNSPLGSLDDVPFAELSPDTVVALAKGEYLGRRILGRSVTLWGACPAETVLRDPDPTVEPGAIAVVEVQSMSVVRRARVTLRNLRIGTSQAWGVASLGLSTAVLEHVVVEETEVLGLLAFDRARLDVTASLVRNTRPLPDGNAGVGLSVQLGAQAEVRRAVFAHNREVGVYVSGADSRLVLEDALVQDTQQRNSDDTFGRGLDVLLGAQAEVRRTVFARNRDTGLFVSDADSRLILEDALVQDTRERASDDTAGRGLSVQLGAQAEVRRAVFARNRELGVFVDGADSRLVLEDALVQDTREEASDGTGGWGLGVQFGAEAEVRRAVFARNREVGVFVDGAGSRVVLEGALVQDTRERASDDTGGGGLNVRLGAQAEVRRAVFARNRQVSVLVGTGAHLILEDVRVQDTREQASDDAFGRGLAVQFGAQAEVRRAVFARNREVGVAVDGANSLLVFEDALVQDTREQASDDADGRGLNVQFGAQAEVRRAVVARNRELGVFVAGDDARLVLEDALVQDTQEQASDGASGRGLNVQLGAEAEVRQVVFARNRDVGVYVSGADSRLVLEDALIQDTKQRNSDDAFGRGLDVLRGARAEVRRAVFARNRAVGVFVGGADARLEDTVIRDTERPACHETLACFTGAGAADALGVLGTSTVTTQRVRLQHSAQCGLWLSDGDDLSGDEAQLAGTPQVDLSDTLVSDNAIGLCLQSEESDLSRVTEPVVRYSGNEVPFERTDFPSPRPAEPPEPIEDLDGG